MKPKAALTPRTCASESFATTSSTSGTASFRPSTRSGSHGGISTFFRARGGTPAARDVARVAATGAPARKARRFISDLRLGVRVRTRAVPAGSAHEVLAAHHGAGGPSLLRRPVGRQSPRAWARRFQLIFPHEPKRIFLRAGGNDIHAGRHPREVAGDFAAFVRTVRARLPKTEIIYIAVRPAPARWGESDKYHELNRLIRKMALDMPHVGFVDAYDVSLTPDGKARPELFVKDRSHFAPEGFTALAERVRPFLA